MGEQAAVIDLRSDTVTVPSAAMREAMLGAAVGDDVYGEDATINDLEHRTAEAFGKEAGLFCVTGSLANQLAVRLLVNPGEELLCDRNAHVVRAELGAHAQLGGVTTRTWWSDHGVGELAQIEQLLAPDAGPYLVSTAALALENTHNFGGGTVQPLEHLQRVHELARSNGIAMHLDGARIWNAHVASGVSLASYGELFDTVSVCFSKGMGAPVGSVVLGSAEVIARARVLRKRMGGGWRQAGILAAGAAFALENNIERLAEDHLAARALADEVAQQAPAAVNPTAVETNIVVLSTGSRPAGEIVAAAAEQGVRISGVGARLVRAVTHLGVTEAECLAAGAVLGKILGDEG